MAVPGLMKWGELTTGQVMIAIFFGTNAFLAALFQYLTYMQSCENVHDRNAMIGSGSGENEDNGEDQIELLERGDDGSKVARSTKSGNNGTPTVTLASPKKPLPSGHTAPFTGTLQCYTTLTSELFQVSVILAFTFICERHWFFEHSGKEYNRDHFLFIVLLFFIYAFYTIAPIKEGSVKHSGNVENNSTRNTDRNVIAERDPGPVLGREQTEEWKGWMQFIFLL